jgi:hypothetical protein
MAMTISGIIFLEEKHLKMPKDFGNLSVNME